MCEKMTEMLESLRDLLQALTTGKKLTLAQWMRQYIYQHPEYKKDSLLSKKLIDNLMDELNGIACGKIKDPNWTPIFKF